MAANQALAETRAECREPLPIRKGWGCGVKGNLVLGM